MNERIRQLAEQAGFGIGGGQVRAVRNILRLCLRKSK